MSLTLIAKTLEGVELSIVLEENPALYFEELSIATRDGSKAYITGPSKWLPVRTSSNLEPLIGYYFDMVSSEWKFENCYVLEDRQSIHFRNAMQLTIGSKTC